MIENTVNNNNKTDDGHESPHVERQAAIIRERSSPRLAIATPITIMITNCSMHKPRPHLNIQLSAHKDRPVRQIQIAASCIAIASTHTLVRSIDPCFCRDAARHKCQMKEHSTAIVPTLVCLMCMCVPICGVSLCFLCAFRWVSLRSVSNSLCVSNLARRL